MDTYCIKYRKGWFWKKVKVSGHSLDKNLDRMDFFIPDGGILSIAQWHKYDMRLGIDWALFAKNIKETTELK